MRAPVTVRPLTAGPDSGPEPPFPIRLQGPVIKGFGRGSAELKIPTANIPITGASIGGVEIESGIYYGYASLDIPNTSFNFSSVAGVSSTEDGLPIGTIEDAGNAADDLKKVVEGKDRGAVFPMVMSIGWNPFYKNQVRSVEVHIIHKFDRDFYGARMKLLVLGWIRPEYDYVSREALIEDIRMDVEVGLRSLRRPAYLRYRDDEFLADFDDEWEKVEGNGDAK
ncbi:riboflavin kinase [Rhizina undulata]